MDIPPKTKEGSQELNPSFSSSKKLIIYLGLAGVFIGLLILLYPFVPYLKYQFLPSSSNQIIPSISSPENNSFLGSLPLIGDRFKKDSSQNRLIIPKIGVDVQIVEGKNDKALLKGAWRIPESSTPDKDGNVVITGHRFRYLPPNNTTFYLLDKLVTGDEIIVLWEQKEYRFRVKESKVVTPEVVKIIDKTTKTILTLYTCTPLFTTRERLVVVSELM